MKFFIFACLVLFLNIQVMASIINTRHNLSVSNNIVPDVNETIIKAQTETEVCVFCHVPHAAQAVGKPLWNRSMPTSAYTMYNSDYLRRLEYPVATELGSANNTPGALSRQCLSCHDGTIAVGAVSKVRGSNDVTISLDGVEINGSIPSSASGFFGTDLSKHHPVGILYDSTPSITFGDGEVRSIELKATPDAPIKLFEYAGYTGKYVECSSCHNPHEEGNTTISSKFLHVSSGSNHAQNVVTTCTSCHVKDGWDASIHSSATNTYSDPEVLANYGSQKVSDLGCANCHMPHNAGGTPYLNRLPLGNTCFQGAASTIAGAACHGIGGAKDIQSNLVPEKLYSHPVVASSSGDTNHTNLDTLYGWDAGAEMTDGTAGGMSWGTNKHAVCMDCHNQHQSKPGTHAPDGEWYPLAGTSTNLVSASGPLTGVPGVEPTWPAAWTQPTTFTTKKESIYEYQICFKCHSYWGIGPAVDGVNTGGHESPSVPGQLLTDVAWEMNKNNKSGHPVVFPNTDSGSIAVPSTGRPGSYYPQALIADQLIAPWKGYEGTITMYCSDCHGSDTENVLGNAKGPHGSNLAYLLKGDNHSWPLRGPLGVDAGTVEGDYYTLGDISDGLTQDLFCKNCHDIALPHTYWANQMLANSRDRTACIECHIYIPHGSPVSRLMGYNTFPEPYNYTTAEFPTGALQMSGFRKTIYTDTDPADVWAPDCGGGGQCHGDADTTKGPYDENLVP